MGNTTKKLIKKLAESRPMQAFLEKPTPKWVVFIADLLIIAFCCAI